MRFRNTAILAAIVALLGAYLYFVERPAVERESEKKTLLEFDPDDVTGILLEYPDRSIRLARRDGIWVISEPRELEADQAAVESLLRTTSEAELKRVLEATTPDLAKFGLEPPAATLQIELADGTKLPAVAVGGSTPIGFNAYARRGEESSVLLTSGAFQSGIKKDLEDLRDKTIVRFEEADVERVTLHAAGEPPTVLVREDEAWRMAEPLQGKADAATAQGLLGSLRAMRARGFAEESAAGAPAADGGAPPATEHGLEAPQFTVALGLRGGETQTVEFGAEKPGEGENLVYVRRSGADTVYEVGGHVLANLAKKPDELRDKTVVAVETDQIVALDLQRADGDGFALERDAAAWRVAGADGATRSGVAERLVEDAAQLRGSRVAADGGDPDDFGLAAPGLRVVLRSADGELANVRLGAKDERFFAALEGSSTVLELPDYVYRRFDKRRADLLEEPRGASTAAAAEGESDGDAVAAGGESDTAAAAAGAEPHGGRAVAP